MRLYDIVINGLQGFERMRRRRIGAPGEGPFDLAFNFPISRAAATPHG
jgi:hypothetical protein